MAQKYYVILSNARFIDKLIVSKSLNVIIVESTTPENGETLKLRPSDGVI